MLKYIASLQSMNISKYFHSVVPLFFFLIKKEQQNNVSSNCHKQKFGIYSWCLNNTRSLMHWLSLLSQKSVYKFTVGPQYLQFCICGFYQHRSCHTVAYIYLKKKNPYIIGPPQFKLTLFKGQLYLL